jgi:hypothetical protein
MNWGGEGELKLSELINTWETINPQKIVMMNFIFFSYVIMLHTKTNHM